VVLSLPDGRASAAGALVSAPDRVTTHVVDTSTVGLAAARSVGEHLAGAGVAYVDAPVSGGVAGAMTRTLTVMYAADPAACAVQT
jgi:3-hydroxyisobutyrate dehydrogenase-like beta-hydroxyacid dehydrogenase